jgi:hypothetical protein
MVDQQRIAGGEMTCRIKVTLRVMALLCCISVVGMAQQTVPVPQPTVPEIFTIEGEFVRVAYNNEGFATLGYRTAQQSVGEDWILLDTGITLRKGTKDYTLKREHLTLKIPNGTSVPLATQKEFLEAGSLRNLVMRDNKINDSINYFPASASRPCAMRFFGQPGQLAYDQVDLGSDRACLGRVFFKVPGGIVAGQYWLNIQFAGSQVQVPFRIMTRDEEKMFNKKWQEMKKAHDEALRQ